MYMFSQQGKIPLNFTNTKATWNNTGIDAYFRSKLSTDRQYTERVKNLELDEEILKI